MGSQDINFTTFVNNIGLKLNELNMSAAQKKYVYNHLNCIFTLGDANGDQKLSSTELSTISGMLDTVIKNAQNEIKADTVPDSDTEQVTVVSPEADTAQRPQEIKNPYFKGLEDYQFEQHPGKNGVGTITVNGEKILISTDGTMYGLNRFNNGKLIEDDITLTSYTKDELKALLQDENRNFGEYSGLDDIKKYFIP